MVNNKAIEERSTARGMSIIELMLSVGILALIAAVATPSFTGIVQNSRIRSQSSDLMATLAIGRAEAAKRGMRVALCASTSYNVTPPVCTGGGATGFSSGYIVFADANANGVFDSGTDVLIMVSEPLAGSNTLTTSATFTGLLPVAQVLHFRPSGATNLPAAGGTFKLCDSRTGNFGRLITITVTGRASSAETSCP
jgi:type IV fimbrial biogenesis protein FimT